MSEPRKMTTDRHKSSLVVEKSVSTHGEQVAAKLAERAQGLPGDFTALDFLAVLLFLQALQANARQKLIAADEAHRDEIADDEGFRKERDAAAADLAELIRTFRDAFRSAYGPTKSKDLGFDPRMGRTPVAVLAQGKRLNARLDDPEKPLPASNTPGVSLVPESLVPPLAAAVTRLETALENVTLEKTEADATLVAKNEALAEFDATYLHVARTLEAIYTLAGEVDLAARVRPTRPRPSRTESGSKPDPGDSGPAPLPVPEPAPIGFEHPLLIS